MLLSAPNLYLIAGWLPPVQAICRITLTSGETIEGSITVYGTEGYNYYRNGFLTTYENREFEFLFDLDFEKLEKLEEDGGVYHHCSRYRGRSVSLKADNLYFIEFDANIENVYKYRKDRSRLDTMNGSYISHKEFKHNYVVKDSIVLFLELPGPKKIREVDANNANTIKISISEIQLFEFLEKPSRYWKKKLTEHHGSLWYHELRQNKNGLEQFRKDCDHLIVNKP